MRSDDSVRARELKPWTLPRLVRIGRIEDVAANQSVVTTQNPAKS